LTDRLGLRDRFLEINIVTVNNNIVNKKGIIFSHRKLAATVQNQDILISLYVYKVG